MKEELIFILPVDLRWWNASDDYKESKRQGKESDPGGNRPQ